MMNRVLRVQGALPLRQRASKLLVTRPVGGRLAQRTVTTDAASSHAEKEHVPEVCLLDQ